MSLFPKIGEGVRAEVVTGDHHLVLLCTETGVGPAASVFNAKSGKWMAREWASDIEDGKAKAERLAKEFLKLAGVPLSTLFNPKWEKTG